jgi:23S rRNA pseudouridine1911/1915/1917 synthase
LNYSVAPKGAGDGPHRLQAPASAAGRRLDQTLAELLPEHSRTRLQAWIEAGLVRVDGALVTAPRHPLAGGESLVVEEGSAGAPTDARAQDIALDVVHEDDALLVID